MQIIIPNLRNPYDVERVCIAFPKLLPYVGKYLNHLRQQEALKCILANDVLSPRQTLCLRKVCKLWRDVVDEHHSKPPEKPNFRDFPVVVIKLPLDQRQSDRVMKMAQHDRCPFVGGKLCLGIQDWNRNVDMKGLHQLLEASSAVWKHVKHLILRDFIVEPRQADDNGVQVANLFAPWLSLMKNVVSINCDLLYTGQQAMNHLPNPHRLEYISVVNMESSTTDEWLRLLFQCCFVNLVRFESYRMDASMQRAVECLHFAKLEQFRMEIFEESSLFKLITPARFPKLKVIGLPLGRKGQNFSKELVKCTNRLVTLETVELYSDYVPSLSLDSYPICISLHGKGSPFVKRLTLSGVLWQFDEGSMRISWMKALSECFPCVRVLQVGNKCMVKARHNGGGSGWSIVE